MIHIDNHPLTRIEMIHIDLLLTLLDLGEMNHREPCRYESQGSIFDVT